MGVFIEVQVEAVSQEAAQELLQVCPVNIFAVEDGQLTVVPENEDECTLCELCLDAAPQNAVRIRKLYKDETLVSRGKNG
jgi:NAD-dependent dihydropyrimidine dehydrogenase PreA subunit